MARIATHIDGFVVRQKKDLAEVFTGIEMRNRYEILDTSGRLLFFASEKKGSYWARQFLRSGRPFELSVTEPSGLPVLTVRRPFRWFLPEAAVLDGSGLLLGNIVTQFSLFSRRLVVTSRTGMESFVISGPVFRPWTFKLTENGEERGRIVKQWSGLVKEAFTKADNFGVQVPAGWDESRKFLALGAIFLIDFMYFEFNS